MSRSARRASTSAILGVIVLVTFSPSLGSAGTIRSESERPALPLLPGDVDYSSPESADEPTGGCSWRPTVGNAADRSSLWSGDGSEDGPLYRVAIHSTPTQLQYTVLSTGQSWGLEVRDCWGDQSSRSGEKRWTLIAAPDPRVLLPALFDEVTKQIDAPVSLINPAESQFINLGLWLAIERPVEHPVVARAEVPGAWAEATGTVVSTTYDMGNGDTVTCAGDGPGGVFGTPIDESDMDTRDEGPCGYTYTRRSDVGAGQITVSTTWEVVGTTSNGYVERRPDLVEVTVVDIHVYEIQTVGGG